MLVAVVLLPVVGHTGIECLDRLDEGRQVVGVDEVIIGLIKGALVLVDTSHGVDELVEAVGKSSAHFSIGKAQYI